MPWSIAPDPNNLSILGSEEECSGTSILDGEFLSNTSLNKFIKRIKNKYR